MRVVEEVMGNLRQEARGEVKEMSRKLADHQITIEDVLALDREKNGEVPSLYSPAE